MLFLKNCVKQVIFFGFLIVCSTSMISAMFTQDNKESAQRRFFDADASLYEAVARLHKAEYGLHEAAVWGNYAKVKELCAQQGIADIINKKKTIGKQNPKARTPIEWAISSLVQYYPFQEKITGEKSKVPHAFDHDFIVTIKELIKHGAVIDLKTALSEALQLEAENCVDMVIDEKEVAFMYELIMQK